MAFVPVPKDLNRVKTKVMFNLTSCFNQHPPEVVREDHKRREND